MSETTRDPIDLRAALAQIDHHQAETRKWLAEAGRLGVNRWMPPVLAMAALLGCLRGAASFIALRPSHRSPSFASHMLPTQKPSAVSTRSASSPASASRARSRSRDA
jgi:hypothetical protein